MSTRARAPPHPPSRTAPSPPPSPTPTLIPLTADTADTRRSEAGADDSEDEADPAELYDDELGSLRKASGAIWDIYRWEDTDAILQLLHAVARERDVEITSNPIHDQLFYLDAALRRRLRDEYGVRGWRFIQRKGDAIFIPAGCPHQARRPCPEDGAAVETSALTRGLSRQVRNVSSCVKVALDFVSPENAHRCVHLTNEFAKLPRGHHLSEDKLQVKALLLHAMAHISEALLDGDDGEGGAPAEAAASSG